MARTIAEIPSRVSWFSLGQASITASNSGSNGASRAPSAPESAPRRGRTFVFPEGFAQSSAPAGGTDGFSGDAPQAAACYASPRSRRVMLDLEKRPTRNSDACDPYRFICHGRRHPRHRLRAQTDCLDKISCQQDRQSTKRENMLEASAAPIVRIEQCEPPHASGKHRATHLFDQELRARVSMQA